MGSNAQEVRRIWWRGCGVVPARCSLLAAAAFSLVSLGEWPSSGEGHLAQNHFLRAAHFLGWVNIRIVRQGSFLQFGTFWRSIPAAELPEVGNEVFIVTISRFALSLILLASLPQQVHSPEDSPISFLPGESVTMTKTFCMRKSYYSLFLVPSSESTIS